MPPSTDARKSIARACERGSVLESVASEITEAAVGSSPSSSADDLRRRVYRLRGLVTYGFTVLAELGHEVGRLEGLATMKEIVSDNEYPER